MGLVVKHIGRFVRDQCLFWLRTGSWWIPAATVVLAIALVLAATAQVVVPHTVYVLF
jgi:hypothetical protein